MKKLLGLTLGIMTALGGFVDLSQIVFTMQAGSLFSYSLLWVVVLGLIAIVIYMEMCGRIAAVSHEAVFTTVRRCLPKKLGVATLVASNLLNLITCAAELGAIGILLHLLTNWNERTTLAAALVLLAAFIWISRLQWIERTFGLAGLLMAVFGVSVYYQHPDWGAVAAGFVPRIPAGDTHHTILYAYFAVGIFSAMLMEYEVHFYSSGAIEEGWTAKESLGENVAVSSLGCTLGAVLTCALVALGALVFLPRRIFPESLSITLIPAAIPFSPTALKVALFGVLACVTGAAVETALSGAYNICQFYRCVWGKNRKSRDAPLFTVVWVLMFVIASGLALSGIEPLTLVNISIIFGMVVMPFTYYPILKIAGNRRVLGRHANGRTYQAVGWAFFGVIVIAAAAAIPLALLTNGGKP